MEQLQAIIEDANRKLVEAKLAGNIELANALQVLIAEAEVALKSMEGNI